MAKGLIFSNSDVPAAKRKQQERDRVMIWAGIFDQTIAGSFKVDRVNK